MQRLPGPYNPLERFMSLLGAGILGTVAFVLAGILLLPVLILLVPYLLYVRWKIKRQMGRMVEQMEQAFGGLGGLGQAAQPNGATQNAAPRNSRGRKHVDVTVKTVGFKDEPERRQ
jgi:hypothetical protein